MRNWFFHIIILGTIIGTAWLGVWQLQRREWKHQLITEMTQRMAIPPVPLTARVGDDFTWRYVRIAGTVDYTRAVKIPRYAQGMNCAKDGAHGVIILAPLKLADGSEVLFRAGWFPGDDFKNAKPQTIKTTGVIHPFNPTWMNVYDAPSNSWLQPAAQMYDALELPPFNYYVDNAARGADCHFPIPLWAAPELPDNHLQYAITWFALAAVLSALYIYRTWQNQKTSAKNPPANSKGSF